MHREFWWFSILKAVTSIANEMHREFWWFSILKAVTSIANVEIIVLE